MGAGAPTFRPSVHGCLFGNNETHRIPIKLAGLPLARVTGGLCGGMVIDSLRAWRDGREPAGLGTSDLSRVFGAQLRSFQVPTAPAGYLRLQQPSAAAARRRTTRRTRQQVAAALRAGEPVPLALVCVLSRSPLALSAHHVVLAYGIVAHGEQQTTLAIYDPNYPGQDDVHLTLGDQCIHSRGRTVHAAFALRVR